MRLCLCVHIYTWVYTNQIQKRHHATQNPQHSACIHTYTPIPPPKKLGQTNTLLRKLLEDKDALTPVATLPTLGMGGGGHPMAMAMRLEGGGGFFPSAAAAAEARKPPNKGEEPSVNPSSVSVYTYTQGSVHPYLSTKHTSECKRQTPNHHSTR